MTREEIKKELEAALLALSADPSLGYLAITSKPEDAVRDRVAWHFHSKHPDIIAAREYTIKLEMAPKRRRRVDLALLKKFSSDPVALLEFKAIEGDDPVEHPEHRLMKSLIHQLKTLPNTAPRFGVMVKVHIEDAERLIKQGLNRKVIFTTSSPGWRRNPDGLRKALAGANRVFEGQELHGSALPIELGTVWDVRVELTALILECR